MKTTVTHAPLYTDPDDIEDTYNTELRDHERERLEAYNENIANVFIDREIPAGVPIPREGETTLWFYDDPEAEITDTENAILHVDSVEWIFHPDASREDYGQFVYVYYTPLMLKQIKRRSVRERARSFRVRRRQ